MHGQLHLESISFSKIDWQDTTYTLSPLPEEPLTQDFIDSITRVNALLHPPILQKRSQKPYLIIAGRRRLVAAREILKLHACHCLILPQDIGDENLFTILLTDATSKRDLTPIEQAIFLDKARTALDDIRAAHLFLPGFGLAPHSSQIQKIIRLLDLEKPIQEAIHRGLLDDSTARELLNLPFRDRMVLFELITDLSLSKSNQRKLTQSCRELASRSRSSITDLLATPEILEILDNSDANIPQKTAKLMARIQNMRLPRYSKAEKDFHTFVASLGLPRGTQLTHSSFFEKDLLTLTTTFPDRESFLKAWPALRDALKKDI